MIELWADRHLTSGDAKKNVSPRSFPPALVWNIEEMNVTLPSGRNLFIFQ
jgi:hypothetical protein